jgi:hypothetical protein
MPHPDNWLHAHPRSGVREKACQTCHPAAFCKACHQGARPADHTTAWTRKHGKVAEVSRGRCMKCHNETYCQVCHRIRMPHPRDIKTDHGALARGADGRYCGLCHATEVCAACHSRRSSMPASHRSDQWRRTHGELQDLDSRCALCHKQKFCQDCHGLPMPHPENWLLSAHGWSARSDPKACAKCHDTAYCRTCHESTPPSTHGAADFRATHGKGAEEALCALCHGRATAEQQDACLTCHRGVKMPHEARFAFKHKGIASFDPQGTCLGCHELGFCKVCHAVVPPSGH